MVLHLSDFNGLHEARKPAEIHTSSWIYIYIYSLSLPFWVEPYRGGHTGSGSLDTGSEPADWEPVDLRSHLYLHGLHIKGGTNTQRNERDSLLWSRIDGSHYQRKCSLAETHHFLFGLGFVGHRHYRHTRHHPSSIINIIQNRLSQANWVKPMQSEVRIKIKIKAKQSKAKQSNSKANQNKANQIITNQTKSNQHKLKPIKSNLI